MDATTLQSVLGWSVVGHYAFLLLWFAVFAAFHDAVYRLHRRFFPQLTVQAFDAVHYAGMAACKVLVLVLFLVPWLVLACGG